MTSKKADHRHRRLLSARHNWPCCRTGNSRDELAPFLVGASE
jgi:hypothetical protein